MGLHRVNYREYIRLILGLYSDRIGLIRYILRLYWGYIYIYIRILQEVCRDSYIWRPRGLNSEATQRVPRCGRACSSFSSPRKPQLSSLFLAVEHSRVLFSV